MARKKSKKARRKASLKDVEPGGYAIGMTITEDCRGFELELLSHNPMDGSDIVEAIRDWLNSNVLEGFNPEVDSKH